MIKQETQEYIPIDTLYNGETFNHGKIVLSKYDERGFYSIDLQVSAAIDTSEIEDFAEKFIFLLQKYAK